MSKITKKMKEEYLASNGSECLFCKNTDISASAFEPDGLTASHRVICDFCGNIWYNIYTLTDVGSDKEG